MLRAPTTAFVLVTSAEREPIDEAIWFHRTLEHGGLPFAGVVVNRVHHDLLAGSEPGDVSVRPCAGYSAAELAGEGRGQLPRLPRARRRETTATSSDWPKRSTASRCCSCHSSTTTSTTSTGCCGCTRYLFATRSERERLIAELVA